MAAGIKLTSINGALTVNLTYPGGATAPAWVDSTFTTPAALPATVGDGATSIFYVKSRGSYVLSVKTIDGTEIAADANTPRTIALEHPGQIAAHSYDARLLSVVVGDSGHTAGGGGTAGVTTFNTRSGTVSLTKTDVTGTGLAAGDVGAASTVHSHAETDVTSLVGDLAGKAAAVHTHAESDTTNLVSDLAAKATTAALTAHTSNTSNPHATTAAQVSAPNYVNHGATAGTARPAGATVVLWAGSVNPTNAITTDLLVDTANLAFKRFNGTTWDLLAPVVSFNSRTGAVTLTKADVTGTGLAAADVAAKPDTIAAAASVVVGAPSGSDDAATIETAIATAITAAVSDGSYVARVKFQARNYKATRAVQQGGTYKANAQIRLPYRDDTVPKVTLILEGAGPAHNGIGTAQSVANNTGTIIESTLTGQTWGATYGTPSLFGGPTYEQTTVGEFVNYMVVLDGITFRCPDNPTLTAVDLSKVSEAFIPSIRCDTPVADSAISLCTHPQAFGLLMPYNDNNVQCHVREAFVWGFYGGAGLGECTQYDYLCAYKCQVGIAAQGASYHTNNVTLAFVTHCRYVIATVAPGTGLVGSAGTLPSGIMGVNVQTLGIEDAPSGDTFQPIYHIYDPNGAYRGRVNYHRVLGNTGTQTGSLTVNGAAALNLFDLVAPTITPNVSTYLTDSFDRANSTTTLGSADSGQAWAAQAGTWGITSNQGYLVTTVNVQVTAATDGGHGDMTVQCDLRTLDVAAGINAGIVARTTDDNNYLLMYLSSSGIQLYKRIAGTYTQLSTTYAFTPAQNVTYTLRMTLSGTTVTCYLSTSGGAFVTAVTFTGSTGLESNTKAGLMANGGSSATYGSGGVRFNNFKITS